MDLNRERLSEQEIQEKILEINQKIDEELLYPEGTDMALVDEYFRQIRELDGMPETSETELKSELQLLYKKAGLQQKRKSPWMFRTVGRRVASILLVIGLLSVLSARVLDRSRKRRLLFQRSIPCGNVRIPIGKNGNLPLHGRLPYFRHGRRG